MSGCVHCGYSVVSRPMGLCWTCYHKPEVRALYRSQSKFAACNAGSTFRECEKCRRLGPWIASVCSTCSRPEFERFGYMRRLDVYAALAAAKQPLFSPDTHGGSR